MFSVFTSTYLCHSTCSWRKQGLRYIVEPVKIKKQQVSDRWFSIFPQDLPFWRDPGAKKHQVVIFSSCFISCPVFPEKYLKKQPGSSSFIPFPHHSSVQNPSHFVPLKAG
jgi:hypothetical protein